MGTKEDGQERTTLLASSVAKGVKVLGRDMTYNLQFLRQEGTPACFFMTQCLSDEQAKAIARSVLDVQFAGVEIVRGDQVIYQEMPRRPN